MDCNDHAVVMERLDRDDKRLEGHDETFEKITDNLRETAVSLERVSTLQETMQQTMTAAIAESKADRAKQAERVTAIETQPASTFRQYRVILFSAAVGAFFGALPQLITLVR